MSKKTAGWLIGGGCLIVILLMVVAGLLAARLVIAARTAYTETARPTVVWQAPLPTSTPVPLQRSTPAPRAPEVAPTPAPLNPLPAIQGGSMPSSELLSALYDRLNPAVVNIQVQTAQGGSTGSGFIIDDQGNIVTNNHVVDGAQTVIVVFFDGHEELADVIGTDDDSDLAVIRVDNLPANVRAVPLGDSDTVMVGEWVMALGSPFGLGSSFTLGIVSARGRTIPSGVTPFSIPEAIQTDAAINPGNSGGPLLNLRGEVIGVNAQIASSGVRANAGVGFAIPANIVAKVVPALIEDGEYVWPWLGISGGSVNLYIQQANRLDRQAGAYISQVSSGGPAERAGLRGSTGTRNLQGQNVPVGGDVVVAIDGQGVENFGDLLRLVAAREPGDVVELTVLRDGRERAVEVTLDPRPQTFGE
jgi:2-alkenal reductase